MSTSKSRRRTLRAVTTARTGPVLDNSMVDFKGARTVRVTGPDGSVREVVNPVKVNQVSKRMAHRNQRRQSTRAARFARSIQDWQ